MVRCTNVHYARSAVLNGENVRESDGAQLLIGFHRRHESMSSAALCFVLSFAFSAYRHLGVRVSDD